MLELAIGNLNYSSWSMRAWLLLQHFNIPFRERYLRFDGFEPDSVFKQSALALSATGKVPVLIDDDLVVWDSLAIAEYLAEQYPDRPLWPAERSLRAQARSVCAQMHSDFAALRTACPMNIEADLRQTGALIWRDHPEVRRDVAQIESLWEISRALSGGPFLFREFSIADAFFAPVCMRIRGYGLPVSKQSDDYINRVATTPAVAQWVQRARAENDFLAFEEPYRLGR